MPYPVKRGSRVGGSGGAHRQAAGGYCKPQPPRRAPAGGGDGGGWPAYRLHVDVPYKEMTLTELIECVESLKHFLSEICITVENKPIFMNAVIQRFNDQFEKEKA